MTQPENTAKPAGKTATKWNTGGIFWGLLLILVGTLLLLDNLTIITVNLANVWDLWPVLIIGAGLSLLSLRGWIGGLVSFLAVIALLGLVAFTIVDNPLYSDVRGSGTQTTVQADTAENADRLAITIETGAADITLSSSQDQRGVEATQTSNQPSLVKTGETSAATRHIVFSAEPSRTVLLTGAHRNSLAFNLTQSLPVTLTINTGATSIRGDLSQVRLTSLDIDTGASSVDLRLGAVQQRQAVTVDAGASSITLHVPQHVGVRVESDSGLTKTTFEGLDKVSDSIYESSGFDRADRQIVIRADLGLSQFEITRY